jgi:hypothetical protein
MDNQEGNDNIIMYEIENNQEYLAPLCSIAKTCAKYSPERLLNYGSFPMLEIPPAIEPYPVLNVRMC